MLSDADLLEFASPYVGGGARVELLKDKPGRRRTVRVRGAAGRVVCKWYASTRAAAVAARISAVATGPAEPVAPKVLLVDPDSHLVILTEVPGRPFSEALDCGNRAACRRVGAAVGGWHRAWSQRAHPPALAPHGIDQELAILAERAATAPRAIATAAHRLGPLFDIPWKPETVVHRDLYEEQILLGSRIGIIDVDDAALGPPELDIGNLLAHLLLRVDGRMAPFAEMGGATIDGYHQAGRRLVPERLERCMRLSLLRLACIHRKRWCATLAASPELVVPRHTGKPGSRRS